MKVVWEGFGTPIYNAQKYIVETKIWEGPRSYQAGVVFDHRAEPEPRVETETIDGLTLRSYVIPVVQEVPSQQP